MNQHNPGFQENRNAKQDALIIRLLAIVFLIGGFQVATQYFAHQFNYQEQLGFHFNHLYAPWSILVWRSQWYDSHPGIFDLAAGYGVLFSSVGLILVLIIKMMLANSSRANRNLYGSARWADKKDIEAAGLLSTGKNTNGETVYVGAWRDKSGKTHYLKHSGPEHVLCFAPTRSGKGVSLVIPTLLSWTQSTVITDLKGELWALTAGWRKHHANNNVLRFDPASTTGCHWNPLDEIIIGSGSEVADVQNLVNLIVDPDGKGLETHWQKTAHASEIGPYTMAQLTEGISYNRMKHITDWHMYEETQRSALAEVVNAISQLDITKSWGYGTTSSSDGQRFSMRRKVLHKSYSHAFNDFALEFYSFVADNYAPYYSTPHECSDRDAPFVLDGLLYNESDLNIEEHYTDTHGFTDTNFAAFAMLGRRFVPRIKGLQKQAIFRIDTEKDYGPVSVLLQKKDRTLQPQWVADEWDRMGHFYASQECGHATASTALKRLNGFTGKNHFYRANRELGRIIRMEYTLDFMSNPDMRRRNRRGLLKGEQIHALARDLKYGHRGKLNNRDWLQQKNSCSSLTLVIACIIYWQAKEIHRVIQEHSLPDHIDLTLLSNISPVSWENIILYGDYILNRKMVV